MVSTPSQPPDPDEPVSDEDAAWRAIVANYGDRPEIEEEPVAEAPADRGEEARGGRGSDPAPDPEERFVPPAPPPVTAPTPARLLAWVGLFGVPFLVLVALVAKLPLPSWLGLLLMVWFVGGFVFLVASMGPGPGEDHDDGARL